ncbi:hypothetical protein L3Q82_018920, partial [Scortum barcoo]
GRPNTTVKVFFYFSSALNNILPRLLKEKLEDMQKFSDDTAIVDSVESGGEEEYMDLVDRFVRWCEENHLQLNVEKTKEMVVGFRRTKSPSSPVYINGTDVEIVTSY